MSLPLQAFHLSARHGELAAVRDVSLQLRQGEAVALVGANGAGKTTLLRTLAGAHPAAGGQVLLQGRDVTGSVPHERVRLGLALVPEGRRLFGDMSVRDNLLVAGENGRRGAWTLDAVLDALPSLRPLLQRPAQALSGGQRQVVAIARALMANPEVLLLDEVSLGLSPLAVRTVYDSLAALRSGGATTLLLVEQDLDRALAFADRVLCMREGAIVLEGAADALSRDAVTQAYFGIDTMEEAP
jgi:branched-chain amino acid transport system ATP-binding protein